MKQGCRFAIKALLAFLMSFSVTGKVNAQLLRVLHTNDLHSHLEHATDPGRGGYAAVKGVIDELRQKSAQEGVETLVLDGGDFLDGSPFYLADRGAESFRAVDAMNYDAVVIGNHDWLMGLSRLDEIVKENPPGFHFLGANFYFTASETHLRKHLQPYASIEKDGMRIGVIGLTTNEIIYSWLTGDGFVRDPVREARDQVARIRAQHDALIALTHIGLSKDKELALGTEGLDLIVGGHSHTLIEDPVYVQDRGGEGVPIVQAGRHGEHVGEILLYVDSEKSAKIIDYQVHPVRRDGPHDEKMEAVVKNARNQLHQDYGEEWLQEVVGRSETPLEGREVLPQRKTVWGQFVAQTLKEYSDADFALNYYLFSGIDQPPGPITREQIFTLYPRIFEFDKPYGWTIWTNRVWGFSVQKALEIAVQAGYPFDYAGVSYDVERDEGEKKVLNIRINGQPLKSFERYTVALPEGIARGSQEISRATRPILSNPTDTGVSIWLALENHIKRKGVIREEDF